MLKEAKKRTVFSAFKPFAWPKSRQNPNCCGMFCTDTSGEVRLLPTGGGGNVILCHHCYDLEMDYRRARGREHGAPENWPTPEWESLKVYDGE